jgi:transposase InsO family protein
MLTIAMIDEYSRESLAIRVARRLNSHDVIDTLAEAMVEHGVPEHIRSDNGPEFIAKRVQKWLAASELGRCTPSRAALGRTATVSRSTASCVTSSSTVRSFTHAEKPKF